MNRNEFEQLRDLTGKRIESDISLVQKEATRPLLTADEVRIENSLGLEAKLYVRHNPETGSTTFNVCVVGVGPVCRLDVNGSVHGAFGRTHKHSLQTIRCPEKNLPDGVIAMPRLAGYSLKQLFIEFCEMAKINHAGNFQSPID